MNKEKFSDGMKLLSNIYGFTPKNGIMSIYWEHLKYLSDKKWNECCKNIIDNFIPTGTNPFPLVPHFLKMGGQDPHTKAVNAVSLVRKGIFKPGVYESVDFGDVVLHGVVERYGGWVEICNWTEEYWRMKESGFIRAYESAAMDNFSNGPKYLSGIHEKNNGSRTPVYLGVPGRKKLLDNNMSEKLDGDEPFSGMIQYLTEKKSINKGKKNV